MKHEPVLHRFRGKRAGIALLIVSDSMSGMVRDDRHDDARQDGCVASMAG
jgi:hypothetical protein